MIWPITSEDEIYFFSVSPSLRSILEQHIHCWKAVEFLTPCLHGSNAKENFKFLCYFFPLLKENVQLESIANNLIRYLTTLLSRSSIIQNGGGGGGGSPRSTNGSWIHFWLLSVQRNISSFVVQRSIPIFLEFTWISDKKQKTKRSLLPPLSHLSSSRVDWP